MSMEERAPRYDPYDNGQKALKNLLDNIHMHIDEVHRELKKQLDRQHEDLVSLQMQVRKAEEKAKAEEEAPMRSKWVENVASISAGGAALGSVIALGVATTTVGPLIGAGVGALIAATIWGFITSDARTWNSRRSA